MSRGALEVRNTITDYEVSCPQTVGFSAEVNTVLCAVCRPIKLPVRPLISRLTSRQTRNYVVVCASFDIATCQLSCDGSGCCGCGRLDVRFW